MFAEVVFPLPIDRTFHYRVPESLLARVGSGCRVLAPFGRRTMTGFVVAVVSAAPAGEFDLKDVKDIKDVLDAEPSFSEGFLAFAKRLGERSFTPWGAILQAALPPALVPKERRTVRLTASGRESLASGSFAGLEKELIRLLSGGAGTPGSLAKRLGVKDAGPLLKRLEGRGMIEVRTAVPRKRVLTPAPAGPRSGQLDLDFARDVPPALAAVEAKVAGGGGYASTYLFGPASVRHAAYGRLVRAAVGRGGKVLFLTPEVSMADALKERAAGWPGVRAAVIHSRLPRREREEEWRALVEGRANLAVGPRSALLAPLDGLALIIVDEEHDESYAQQEGQLYDARRGACLRASGGAGAVVVFGSSTPSVEAYYQALEAGTLVSLEGPAPRCRTSVVDDHGEKAVLSDGLLDKIKGRLDRGDPIILFVNRRGYAPAVTCPACGYSPRCLRCDIAVSYHKKRDEWVCHYCNSTRPASPGCPKCGTGLVRRRAKGIEAVEEELRRVFPGVRPARFDADDAAREKDRDRIVEDFRRGKVRILLGTSLLAHRADVPPAPLVGVIAPEALLGLADYRAGQWAFQSLARMRAFAEDDDRAEVVLQTSDPGHFIIRAAAAADHAAFYAAEIESRRALGYPPFMSLAEVVLQGRDIRTLARKSREFATALGETGAAIHVLGPALASVSRARGSYRVQVIVKAEDEEVLAAALRRALERSRVKRSIRVSW